MWRKMIIGFLIPMSLLLFLVFPIHAQESSPQQQRYFTGVIQEVVKEKEIELVKGQKNFSQTLKVLIKSGDEKGKEVTIEHGGIFKITPNQKLHAGTGIIVIKTIGQSGNISYAVFDTYRLRNVIMITLLFFLFVIGMAGKKGIGAIVGMMVSLLVIMQFIVPQILAGNDPLLISITGSLIIMCLTIYLAHGISKQTTIALGATFITLLVTGFFSYLFVKASYLTGLGNENTYLLQFGPNSINLEGILLGGMIIGALGVLDDITTAQSAAVFTLLDTDKTLSFKKLYYKAYRIGKEHITSLVNTLVLAYAGASLSLFILFVLNPSNQPYWVILNSEVITEEIIRTLAGSMGLILAVPITTAMAAFFATIDRK